MDAILPRIASGDRTAADEMIGRYGALVWSIARRFSPSDQDAEDICQEIFLDLWQSASRYDPSKASEATFISMVTRRRCIDRMRQKSRSSLSSIDFDLSQLEQSADYAETDLAEEAELVRQRMAKLKPEEKRVLELSFGEGLSQSEIAVRTGMPLGSVKTNARRGLIRLRQLLGMHRPASMAGGEA